MDHHHLLSTPPLNPRTSRPLIHLPPEIIHEILIQLKEQPDALKSCALASHTFQAISRPIQFIRTTISTASMKRFFYLLQSSPAIASYIQHLRITISYNVQSFCVEVMHEAMQMVCKSLRELTVTDVRSGRVTAPDLIDWGKYLTKAIQYILQYGNLQRFALQRIPFRSSYMQELFSLGSGEEGTLEMLDFSEVNLDWLCRNREGIPNPINMLKRVKPRVVALPLSISGKWEVLLRWLTNPRCAVDLNAMEELHLFCSSVDDISVFVQKFGDRMQIGTRVKKLKLNIRQKGTSLDDVTTLSSFESLQSLEIHCSSFGGIDHISFFPHIISTFPLFNRLDIITLSWDLDDGAIDSFVPAGWDPTESDHNTFGIPLTIYFAVKGFST